MSETCQKWSPSKGFSGGRCERPVVEGHDICPRHLAGQRRRENNDKAMRERADQNIEMSRRCNEHRIDLRNLIEAVRAFLAAPQNIYGLIYAWNRYKDSAAPAGYPEGVIFDGPMPAGPFVRDDAPAFQEFDAEWSKANDRPTASPGGVRETYFLAGFKRGRAIR